MWTRAHRARHDARLKEVVSLHAVGEVARWLERADPPRSARATPYAAVVRGLAWHLRVGGAWRALPFGLVHWRTAYGWLRRWLALGLFEALLRHVAGLRRRAAGRKSEPRLAVIDTQSVACIPVRGPRGYDAAKKVLGRKRVALVDADGTWLAVAVVPADVQDRDCLDALTPGKQAWPSLREAVLDGAFVAERCEAWCNLHGMRRRVVERDPARKGFVVLERRWVVERSFGWLVHWGGLLRDRAGRLDVSAARVTLAAVLSGVEALINPMPIQDAARFGVISSAWRPRLVARMPRTHGSTAVDFMTGTPTMPSDDAALERSRRPRRLLDHAVAGLGALFAAALSLGLSDFLGLLEHGLPPKTAHAEAEAPPAPGELHPVSLDTHLSDRRPAW